MPLDNLTGIIDLVVPLFWGLHEFNTEKTLLTCVVYILVSVFPSAPFMHFLEKCYRRNMEN